MTVGRSEPGWEWVRVPGALRGGLHQPGECAGHHQEHRLHPRPPRYKGSLLLFSTRTQVPRLILNLILILILLSLSGNFWFKQKGKCMWYFIFLFIYLLGNIFLVSRHSKVRIWFQILERTEKVQIRVRNIGFLSLLPSRQNPYKYHKKLLYKISRLNLQLLGIIFETFSF